MWNVFSPEPKAPDANFTIRLTYGNVKSYNPARRYTLQALYDIERCNGKRRPHQSLEL